MCRLGFIYVEREDKKDVAKTILTTAIAKYYLQSGNDDGVGLGFVMNGKLCIVKDTNIATIFHYLGKVNPFDYTNLVVFHTRKATTGRVNSENAHPFISEDNKICLVHNGHVYNDEEMRGLLKRKGHRFKTQVDSEVILHAFEEFLNGDKRVLKKVDAYGTFLVLTRDNKLYLASGNGFKVFIRDGLIMGFSDSSLSSYISLGKEKSITEGNLYLFENGLIKNLRFKVNLSYASSCYVIDGNSGYSRIDGISDELERLISKKLGVEYHNTYVYFNDNCSKAKIWIRVDDEHFENAKKFFNLNRNGQVFLRRKTLKKFLLRLCENKEEIREINTIFEELKHVAFDVEKYLDEYLERGYRSSSRYGLWGY